MNWTIYYSNPEKDDELKQAAETLAATCRTKGDEVACFNLDKLDFSSCKNCWKCWWNTPGQCSEVGAQTELFQAALNSDRILFLTPVEDGVISSDLHLFLGKLIPMLHPYTGLLAGSRKRYPRMTALMSRKGESRNVNFEYFDPFGKNFFGRIEVLTINSEAGSPILELLAG